MLNILITDENIARAIVEEANIQKKTPTEVVNEILADEIAIIQKREAISMQIEMAGYEKAEGDLED